jgi:hypothetical protein
VQGLASAVILGSEYRRTHDHILLSQIRDSPNLQGQVPVFISPGTGWPGYTPGTEFHFRRLLRLAGSRWRYPNPPPRGLHCLQPAWGPRYIGSGQTQQKTPPFLLQPYCCVHLVSARTCLPCRYQATDVHCTATFLHVTVYFNIWLCVNRTGR